MKDYVVLSLDTYDQLREESDIYRKIDAFAQNNDLRATMFVDAYIELRKELRILRSSEGTVK